MTDDNDIFPIVEYFARISCSCCDKKYGEDFARCREQGIPVYYKWEGKRPLDGTTLGPAISGEIKVDWFCSAKCSSAGANLLLRAQNEKQPTSSSTLQEFYPSPAQALLRDQLGLFRKPGK